jgi:hypothetical protein
MLGDCASALPAQTHFARYRATFMSVLGHGLLPGRLLLLVLYLIAWRKHTL